MKIVDERDAELCLEQWIEQATAGEEIVIARAGIPMARLMPMLPNAGDPPPQ